MTDTEVVRRLFFSLISAFCIVNIVSYAIGDANKRKWFRQRKTSWFFNRRGLLGERMHFGYPATREGIGVFFAMLFAILLVSFIIFSI